jgi:hypothetical protein
MYTLEQIQNDPELSSVYENQSEEGKKSMLGENYTPPAGSEGGDGGSADGGDGGQQNPPTGQNANPIDDILNAGNGNQPKDPKLELTPDQRVAQMRGELVNEMFGGRFKTFEEAQLANIPQVLDEVETLRQRTTELQTKLEAKPKNLFVNDDLAKFNEFVRDTGISNYNVFNTLNTSEIDKMDDLNALVMQYIVENPDYTGRESEIRGYFERKYQLNLLDGKDVDEMDEAERRTLEAQVSDNKIQMGTDARSAKKQLLDMKGKIKMPEFAEDKPTAPEGKSKEELEKLSGLWNNAKPVISKQLSKFSIPLGKDSFVSYELSEDEQKEIGELAYEYAVKNQLELNADNAKTLRIALQKEVLFAKFNDIANAIAVKVSKMTEQEQKAIYHNPSAKINKNIDAPPAGHQEEETSFEISQRKALELEGMV